MNGPADDPFELQRFLDAQRTSYENALGELTAGCKESHWSWFVLPQVLGLGTSAMSTRYAIRSLAEARAYLSHPVLGARLITCVKAMMAHADVGASRVLGDVDAQKFRSCLTLFAQAGRSEPLFAAALEVFFDGRPDAATLEILARQRQGAGTA
jgi:uncharacterized protein (DUF1810 family)